jgi:hydrogenase nickel incorporation protein HypA/HybF
MHELSIATTIAELAQRCACGRKVSRIELRVGHRRQVVPSTLISGFQLITKGTPLEGACLALEIVPLRGRCVDCGVEGPLRAFPLACSSCSSASVRLTHGEELLIAAIEIEETIESEDPSGARLVVNEAQLAAPLH